MGTLITMLQQKLMTNLLLILELQKWPAPL